MEPILLAWKKPENINTMRLLNMKLSTEFFQNEHPVAFSLFINKFLLHLG